MEVAAAWEVIEEWLAANAKTIRKSLRPPATETAIDKLQQKLGQSLPADFVASVRVHDGQKSEAEHGLFPPPANDPSEPSYTLFSLADVGREWAMMKELLDTGNLVGARLPKAARGVQNVVWSPNWVPIADNCGGDYYCLDLAPTRGGTVGQVIAFGHEGTAQLRVAKSFADWLAKLARSLKAGKYAMDENEGIVPV